MRSCRQNRPLGLFLYWSIPGWVHLRCGDEKLPLKRPQSLSLLSIRAGHLEEMSDYREIASKTLECLFLYATILGHPQMWDRSAVKQTSGSLFYWHILGCTSDVG
ncbi:hypothetical protein AVEN_133170-1 [Araneus ventricosus]|uniref:Uncharacterized protein n=1 Tax=Araneus ventricosus TaxID=182803 RepID=A0A4Y2UF20_ARAVE|nr:hypothetical protein AVEN_133170-1 [Araneus ventricosus]